MRPVLTYLHDQPFFCPVCRGPVDEFLEFNGRPRARCPKCLSMERHRFLSYLIDRLSVMVASAGVVLELAPQLGITEQLISLAGARYVGFDIDSKHRKVGVCGDVQRLPFRDGVVDLVVCYHVLEHIPDDYAALGEIARVMSPRSLMLFQVPYRARDLTIEDVNASVEERARRFGQADHVRFYGHDIHERFATCGLEATLIFPDALLHDADIARFGIRAEPVWLCHRADSWRHRRPDRLEPEVFGVAKAASER